MSTPDSAAAARNCNTFRARPERYLHAPRSPHGEGGINQLTKYKKVAERAAERHALLIAYAFQSDWAARFLTPDPRSEQAPARQRKYMFMLAAARTAPHLDFLHYDEGDTARIWKEARALHDRGPLALTESEAQFMLDSVLDMEESAKVHRAAVDARIAAKAKSRSKWRMVEDH